MRPSIFPVSAALFLLGCSGGSSSSSSSSSSGGGNQVAALFSRLSHSECAREDRCAATNGRNYADVAACNKAGDDLYNDPTFGSLYAEMYLVDGALVETCATDFSAAMAALPCDALGDTPIPESCRAAVKPREPAALGEVCQQPGPSTTSKNCGWDATCATNSAGCGVCRPSVSLAQGSGCSPSGTRCTPGLYCAPSSTCQPKLPLGSACSGSECRGNLSCEGPAGGARTCKARVGAGQPCDEAYCMNNLTCVGVEGSRTCAPDLADGATCTRTTGAAGCAGYCSFASANATSGTCVSGNAPSVDQPCGWYAYGSSGSSTCAYDSSFPQETRSGTNVTACTCRAIHATGACSDVSECTISCEGLDYSMTPPGPGTCSTPVANGTACFTDRQCTSGYCNNSVSPSVCAAVPACP